MKKSSAHNIGRKIALVGLSINFASFVILVSSFFIKYLCLWLYSRYGVVIHDSSWSGACFEWLLFLTVVFYFLVLVCFIIALFDYCYRSRWFGLLFLIYNIINIWLVPGGMIIWIPLIIYYFCHKNEFAPSNKKETHSMEGDFPPISYATLLGARFNKNSFYYYIFNSIYLKISYIIVLIWIFFPIFMMLIGERLAKVLGTEISETIEVPSHYILGVNMAGVLNNWTLGGFWITFAAIPSGIIILIIITGIFYISYLLKKMKKKRMS